MPRLFDWRQWLGVPSKSPELVDSPTAAPSGDEIDRFVPRHGQLRESATKRPSQYAGLLQDAVSNDDGTRVTEYTEELLRVISDQLGELITQVKALRQEVTND